MFLFIYSYLNLFESVPISSNQISMSSPSRIVSFGSRAHPIPLGVPIWMMVPLSNVVPWLKKAIAWRQLNIISLAKSANCRCSLWKVHQLTTYWILGRPDLIVHPCDRGYLDLADLLALPQDQWDTSHRILSQSTCNRSACSWSFSSSPLRVCKLQLAN